MTRGSEEARETWQELERRVWFLETALNRNLETLSIHHWKHGGKR